MKKFKVNSLEGAIFIGVITAIVIAIVSFNISETEDDIFVNMLKGQWLVFILSMTYIAINFYKDMKRKDKR
jgi:Na+/serine symporter